MQEKFQEILNNLAAWGIGEQLKQAEVLAKDKEKAIAWVEKLILILREKTLKGYSSSEAQLSTALHAVRIIKIFQALHTLLKTTNVNPRFAIENTLLTL